MLRPEPRDGDRRKRRLAAKLLAVIMLLTVSLPLCGFMRAVNYTGDEWAVNFWDTEMTDLSEDLDHLIEDGFDTVVLCVPWRQFQPLMQATASNANRSAMDKLELILEEADKKGVGVMLRVGYTWDQYDLDSNVLTRYYAVRTDPDVRSSWRKYAGTLYDQCAPHVSFRGGFMTWEDFWNYVDNTDNRGKGTREEAQKSGYASYVFRNHDLDEIREYYRSASIDSEEDLYYPEQELPAAKWFYEWNDEWLSGLLLETQEVFPDLSMEVRLDVDPVIGKDGEPVGVPHYSTYPCGGASYACCMYAACMGYGTGSEITAAEGLSAAEQILKETRDISGGKPLFIDQFLYQDNTPGFELNAHIRKDQLSVYIRGMAELIRRTDMGYAVWTWRDYGDNKIYNGQFANGDKEWKLRDGASVIKRDGNGALYLPDGGEASQVLRGRRFSTNEFVKVSFRYRTEGDCTVMVSASGLPKKVTLNGEGTMVVETDSRTADRLTLSASGGSVELDNIKAYTHVTEGGLYGIDGSEGELIEDIRALNRALAD